MTQSGNIGYKIGKKVRVMRVTTDADLLWQIGVREIYVLLKKYPILDSLLEAFGKVKEIKPTQKYSKQIAGKCKWFTFETDNKEWSNVTQYCQHSYINILESGYILNNGLKQGLTLLLDFNTNSLELYEEKDKLICSATFAEILAFDDMPTKTYTEIVDEMKERYEHYIKGLQQVDEELDKIQSMINKARELGNEQNIVQRALKMKDDKEWEKKKLHLGYRFFYHRLNALNLIEHTC